MKAVEIANQWFEEGKYQEMKKLKEEKDAIQKELKTRMGEMKRINYITEGVVTKFIANNKYSIDTEGLNSFLYLYGILTKTVKFSTNSINSVVLEKIASFIQPLEYYTKLNVRLPKEKFELQDTGTKDLIKRWKVISKKHKSLEDEYAIARDEMNECPDLIAQGKLTFDYGTISRVKKEATYDIESILSKYGAEFVITHATPVSTKIDNYIEEGYFQSSEVEKFKKLISMDLKFIVMTLEDESKLINFLTNKNSKSSIRNEQIKKQLI